MWPYSVDPANRTEYTAGDCEWVGEEASVDFTGTWDVVSSPDFDDEYLRLGGAPLATREAGVEPS